LDLPSLKRTWTRTWTCSLKVDLDLDFTVAGLVTSLLILSTVCDLSYKNSYHILAPLPPNVPYLSSSYSIFLRHCRRNEINKYIICAIRLVLALHFIYRANDANNNYSCECLLRMFAFSSV